METTSTFFIAEIIAAIAVVITLIHLGIQLRQSRLQSVRDSVDAITRERAEFIRLLATDADLSRIVPKGLAADTRLPAGEYFRFTSYLYYLFIQLEMGFRKWKSGEIDEDLWAGWHEAVHWWLRCPGTRSWWRNNAAGGFTRKFQNYVNAIIEETASEPAAHFAAQRQFLAEAGGLT